LLFGRGGKESNLRPLTPLRSVCIQFALG